MNQKEKDKEKKEILLQILRATQNFRNTFLLLPPCKETAELLNQLDQNIKDFKSCIYYRRNSSQ